MLPLRLYTLTLAFKTGDTWNSTALLLPDGWASARRSVLASLEMRIVFRFGMLPHRLWEHALKTGIIIF